MIFLITIMMIFYDDDYSNRLRDDEYEDFLQFF